MLNGVAHEIADRHRNHAFGSGYAQRIACFDLEHDPLVRRDASLILHDASEHGLDVAGGVGRRPLFA